MPLFHGSLSHFKRSGDYWPVQGDEVSIIGDSCATLSSQDVINNAGQSGGFVWKMRDCPGLPVPREFADGRMKLVGDGVLLAAQIVFPVDWSGQEGLDLLLHVPLDQAVIEVPVEAQERRTAEGRRRRAAAILSRGFIIRGVDIERDGWLLRPAPHPALKKRAFELAEVFVDGIIEESPEGFELLEELGKNVLIHRDWPVLPEFGGPTAEVLFGEQIVERALLGGKPPEESSGRDDLNRLFGLHALFGQLYIPDWSDMDLAEIFRDAVNASS